MEQKLPSFESTTRALSVLKAMGETAEVHGLLTALFVSGAMVHSSAWVGSMLSYEIEDGDVVAEQAKDVLMRLFDVTQHALENDDCAFDLLLPTDDINIEQRIESLAYWAQGFMTGLNLAGVPINEINDPQLKEAFDDLINMSCLSYDNEPDNDAETENAYVQLVEYARVAVMLVKVELSAQKGGSQFNDQTIH